MNKGKFVKITGSQRKIQKKKPFAAVEFETITSDQWQYLRTSEAWVYTILKTFYKGEGKSFKAPFAGIKLRSRIRHGVTINKAVQGLEMKGWINVIRYAKHGKRRGLRVRPNEYELTFKYDRSRW